MPSGGIQTKARYVLSALIVLIALGTALWGYRSVSLELAEAKSELSKSAATSEILREDLERSNEKIAELTRAKAELEQKLSSKNEELIAALGDIASLNNEIGDLRHKMSLLESGIAAINASLVKTREEISILNYSDSRSTRVLAVNDIDVAMPIEIEARNGVGLLLDMEGVLLDETVQESMKTAFKVAQEVTGDNLDGREIIFRIRNTLPEVVTITGESAGAAMTIALIALAEGKAIRKDVLITGVIQPDGSIGRAAGIAQKARAAREANATTLLVPVGRATVVEGIDIIEVANITVAMDYMLE